MSEAISDVKLQSDGPGTGQAAWFSRKTIAFVLVALCLLCSLVAEEWLSIGRLSTTYDEGAHLYAGYQHWTARDFGVNPEHPPLVKLLAAAPLLSMQLKQPQPPRFFFLPEQYIGGGQLLAENDAYRLLGRARTAVSLFTFALAILVFSAAYEMFGPMVALLALALFTFEPTVLAHGALVTTDMGVACFTFAGAYAYYRYLKQPGMLRLVLSGIAAGLSLAAKVSGVLILPILVILSLAELLATPVARGRKAGRLIGAVCLIGLIGYVVLWAFYTFRYAARPSGVALVPSLAQLVHMGPKPWQTSLVLHLAGWHLFPEAYLFAWTKLYTHITASAAFLLGRIYPTGTWFYFPVALVIKSTLTLLILLAAAPFVLGRFSRESITLWTGIATILLACMVSTINIGVRHALALYPFAVVLAAASAYAIGRKSRVGAVAVAALLVFQCVSSVRAFPDYLPYSNEAFGGSSKTYLHLTDSNVDWAQQLKEVNTWLAAHHTTDCWFAYSAIAGVPDYDKVPCKPLPTGLALTAEQPEPIVPPHISGTVLVSAVDASGALWGPGNLNPYRQFQDGHPTDMIGNSILVYEGDFDIPLAAAETHVSQVPLLLRMHQEDAALHEAQTAVAIDARSPAIEASLGGTLLRMNRVEEAQKAFAIARDEAHAQSAEEATAVDAKIAAMLHPQF